MLYSVIYCYTQGGNMKIVISNSSPTPIYEQIKQTIISQIMNNELLENEPLPSIRTLAQDIKISVMTIKKAYDELENEGYIKSIQGKGTFVSPKNNELIRENIQKKIENHLKSAINLAKTNKITKKDIQDIITILWSDEL